MNDYICRVICMLFFENSFLFVRTNSWGHLDQQMNSFVHQTNKKCVVVVVFLKVQFCRTTQKYSVLPYKHINNNGLRQVVMHLSDVFVTPATVTTTSEGNEWLSGEVRQLAK